MGFQPLCDVGDAKMRTLRRTFLGVATAVFDDKRQGIVRRRGRANSELYRFGTSRNRILDRILNQRLGNQAGHKYSLKLRRHLDADDKSVREPNLFYREIELLQLCLFGQGDQILRIQGKCDAEKVSEVFRHRLGLTLAPARNETGDGIQRIEEKMGIELIAKGPQLRIVSKRLQCTDTFFTFTDVINIRQRENDCGERCEPPKPNQIVRRIAYPERRIRRLSREKQPIDQVYPGQMQRSSDQCENDCSHGSKAQAAMAQPG